MKNTVRYDDDFALRDAIREQVDDAFRKGLPKAVDVLGQHEAYEGMRALRVRVHVLMPLGDVRSLTQLVYISDAAVESLKASPDTWVFSSCHKNFREKIDDAAYKKVEG